MRNKHSSETKDKVLTLWNAKMSAQRIADRLGLTKNTVIAMVRTMRRNGLHVRTESLKRNPYKKPRAPATKKRAAPQALVVYEPPKGFTVPKTVFRSTKRWVPLLHLDNDTCRYTKDGKTFCNAQANGKGSYCEEHAPIMYSGTYRINVNFRQLVRR